MSRTCRHTITDAPEAVAFLALTAFTGYFLNCAQPPMNLPGAPAAADEPG